MAHRLLLGRGCAYCARFGRQFCRPSVFLQNKGPIGGSRTLVSENSLRRKDLSVDQKEGQATVVMAGGMEADNHSVEKEIEELGGKVPKICFGCGIYLQNTNPDAPGYFQVSQKLIQELRDKKEEEEEKTRDDASGGFLFRTNEGQALDDLMDGKKEDEGKEDDKWGSQNSAQWKVELEDTDELEVLCARCYSLKHYGKVKSKEGEKLVPDFDLGKKVGTKIALQKARRAVILCVVDATDFDGSLPRLALKSVYQMNASGVTPRLILAANKFDLIPQSMSRERAEIWIRTRAKQAGFPRLAALHLISCTTMFGIQALLQSIVHNMGIRGDLWVVGAQNAGKSSLINSLRKATGTSGKRDLTTAPLPGTTLGLVEVKGLPVPRKCRVFDTPGVKHEHQLSTQLRPEELAILLPSRKLRPRTFRTGADHSLLIGGIARVDIVSVPSHSLYLTVWASDEVTCHLGKTEGVEERRLSHLGSRLKPPFNDQTRMESFPELTPCEFDVLGSSWKRSSADICISGLGWIGIGVEGRAVFRVWTFPSTQVTTRDSFLADYAKVFEKPGFSTNVTTGGLHTKKKKVGRRK